MRSDTKPVFRVGAALRRLRKSQAMSQEGAAERAGLNGSGQAWSRLERENGYSQALSVLAIAAKGVGLTLQQLIEEAQKVGES